ncbi:MAG: fumarylacetoacetate hydrolase family protein [Acidimicrobiia bacterium]
MSPERLDEIAGALDEAWARGRTVPAPSSTDDLTIEEAYEIQELLVERRIGRGRRRIGWKMGLTTAGPGTTPIVGTLLDDMVVASGTTLSRSSMVGPQVEAELVVEIGVAIERPVSAAELADGPHRVAPGIEVIDYRTTDSTGVVDWVADNSTVAYAVVGESVPVGDVSLPEVETTLSDESGTLAHGRGDQVMGNPLSAVAWLSHHLITRGHRLEPGDVILTGSLTGHHPVVPDASEEFEAVFGSLGSVSVRFTP